MPLADAVTKAIYYCMREGIMKAFLERHGAEVASMLTTIYSFEDEKKFDVEAAEKRGEKRGEDSVYEALRKLGYNEQEIARIQAETKKRQV